ncbi:Exocyst complex component Sec5 [Sporothrix brasiliensis 5110]|uniref:Exocyst complex component SEC5 n=1 Tax=Sporothrix brasiliensis 5110 TaxID=1398154 RepID=A0A0C2F720_9PEZI|nr:Exocyst complex component Sec5 [Sporothrix brasiliensis 5110]KIH94754.1 Exocyst complex component Sec5 [Sporothrix brasiliensis 5110]
MTDLERSVLDFYQISTAYPDVWPADKNNDSDGSDGETMAAAAVSAKDRERKAKLNRRKSRYQALERAATQRQSTLPGADKGVQRDEPDPLGTTDSVILALKRNGLANVQDDPKLRNRFLLSSTTFSPAFFLSQVHRDASTEALVAGIDVLSRSIDQKSASLKVLVESNFERFVRAKATIDNVYKEMKYYGGEPTPPPPPRARPHSRHSSRSGGFRGSISGGVAGAGGLGSPGATPPSDTRKRNALVKESEYGVLGIKVPLLEVSAKAEDVWGPALGGREKEETLRVLSGELSRFQEYVEASAAITESIKRNDHESLVEEYHRARRFADEARALAQELQKKGAAAAAQAAQAAQAAKTKGSRDKNGGPGGKDDDNDDNDAVLDESRPTDAQMYQILLAARMWHDVEDQIQVYKRDVWRRLTSMHSNVVRGRSGADAAGGRGDQHMELIGLLLELGVEDNPIWVWLLSRYDYLKGKIQAVCDRTKVEIEVLRRRLAAADKPAPHVIAAHLRSIGRQTIESKIGSLDSPDVIELWDKIHYFLVSLLSAQGVLGEVLEFWHTVEGFVEGKTQKSLPSGYRGEAQTHHRLSQQGAVDLQKGAVELVDLIREHVFSFFAGPPPEDVSLLFSPIPLSPRTPMSTTSLNGGFGGASGPLSPNALRDPRFNLDPKNPPPPSPRRGEAWEKFAFWPPWSNSVSGVHYLSKYLALVGAGASEMAGIGSVAGRGADATEVERLRTLVGAVRERCVAALCAAWNKDAENVKYVEDWHRAADRRDVTKMPAAFAAFEGAILSGMQKILYVSEAMSKPGAGDIVLPPPTKLLQMVRAQYVTTLYKALSGMVENAERPMKRADDDWTTTDADGVGYVAPPSATAMSSAVMSLLHDSRASSIMDNGAFNAGDRNVRMLLTLSNLQSLRVEVVPRLNTQFENAFSVKLTDETKTIRDVLGQIDTRLFLSYTRPSVESLRRIVRAGIIDAPPVVAAASASASASAKPREVRPYVYEALLLLVLVHSQVSTTAASLTQQVLSHLLEQLSRELLEAFKQQPRAAASPSGAQYDLAGLMQATLDVEFIAQALSQYTTERASELQGQIYQELDARTDDDARARLQGELPEMRSVLKRLREASKNEFACFRKPKRSGGDRGERGERGGSRDGASSPAPQAGPGQGVPI